jgi:hypothetical protein
LEAFNRVIATCGRGFLLTLDGFDTAFDTFRRDSIIGYKDQVLAARTQFEIDWLRSFLRLILRIKQSEFGPERLYRLLEFCITVPKDRFLELLRTERDSYQYGGKYSALNWSGIELAILVRKRLEALCQYKVERRRLPEHRLADIFRHSLSHIPLELLFTFNGKQYSLPLFIYILRHTFWRPRDVLLYLANVLSAAELIRRRGQDVTVDLVRCVIKNTTFEVIKSEFVNEFGSTVINIVDILRAFNRSAQALDFEALAEILHPVEFMYASGADGIASIAEKIEFLYNIGFLGVVTTKDIRSRYGLVVEHAFYFNGGQRLLSDADEDRYRNYVFLIHPIFCEYLELDTTGRDLALVLTWEGLHEAENQEVGHL